MLIECFVIVNLVLSFWIGTPCKWGADFIIGLIFLYALVDPFVLLQNESLVSY